MSHHSSIVPPPSMAQVTYWFRQAATGSTCASEPLQAWITAAQTVESHRSAALQICLSLIAGGVAQVNENANEAQNNEDLTMRFYALTTLTRIPWKTAQEVAAIRQTLMTTTTTITTTTTRTPGTITTPPPFWRNKVAAVLVQCYLSLLQNNTNADAATAWPHDDTRTWAIQQPTVFCKWITTLLQTIVIHNDQRDKNLKHNTTNEVIKQVIKQPSTTTGVSLRMEWFQMTTQLVQQGLANDSNSADKATNSSQEIVVLALETIKTFLAWTDWQYLQNDTTLQVMFQAIQQQQNEIRLAALETWHEWVSNVWQQEKEQQSASAIHSQYTPILQNLVQHVHAAKVLPYQGESEADIEVVIAAAKLVNTLGQAMLAGNQQINKNNNDNALQEQILDLCFRALQYDDIDVSAAVLPWAKCIVAQNDNDTVVCQRILQVIFHQVRYPADFDYDFTDDIAAEEEMYRTQLDKLYVRLVQRDAAMVLAFLNQAVGHYLRQPTITTTENNHINNNNNNARDVEAVLRFTHHFCQGIQPAPGVKTVMNNESFCQLLVTIQQQSTWILHPQQHFEVLRWYFETAVRYNPLYQQEGNAELLLGPLLSALTGHFGLQHPHTQLRSRCCFLLLRLVKALIVLLTPLVTSAVTGILGLLSNSNLSLRPDDTLYLFETIGLLLGRTGLPAAEQQTYLAQVMTPHVLSMEQILTAIVSSTQATTNDENVLEEAGESLSRSIAAITYLSKGFRKQPPEPVQLVLLESINVTLKVLERLAMSEPVRSKSMTFLQRMIQCLDGDVRILASVPRYLAPLIHFCTADDCLFVAQIFNQVCIKFQGEAAPALDACLLPFLQKCQSLIVPTADVVTTASSPTTTDVDVPPHLQTEQLGIQKLCFSVVEHIVCNQATSLLLTSTNTPHLERILGIIADGAVHVTEPVMRKSCIRIFRELTDQWIVQKQAAAAYQRGLLSILYQKIIPGVLVAFLSPRFDPQDAQQNRNVTDYGKLLFTLHSVGETGNVLQSLYGGTLPAGSLDDLRAMTEAKEVERLVLDLLSKWKQ